MKPPVTAASTVPATELSYFNCVEMLVNLPLRVVPVSYTHLTLPTKRIV